MPAPDDGVDDAAPPTAELIKDDACEAALATEALAPEDIAEPEAMDAMEVADAAEAIDVPERLAAMEETRDALTEVAEAPAEMEAPETPLAAATLAQRACCRASADCCSAVVQLLGLAGKGKALRGSIPRKQITHAMRHAVAEDWKVALLQAQDGSVLG